MSPGWLGTVVQPIRSGIKPDFMAARSLPIELKAMHLQFTNDVSVPESCQAAHLGGDDDGVVAAALGGW